MCAMALLATNWWEFEWISDPDPVAVVIALCVVVASLLFLVLFDIAAYYRYRRQVRERQWRTFDAIATLHRLIPSEITLLKRLVRHAPDDSPVSGINSPANFDLCVEQEIAQIAREGGTTENIDETTSLISSMRRKLGLDYVTRGHFFRSTHSLAPNQELKITAGSGDAAWELLSSVVRVSEREIMISVPEKRGESYALEEGAKIVVEFVRENDAIYRFPSRILKNFSGRLPLVFIAHSRDMERIQLRRHFRIETEMPVRYRVLAAEQLEKPLEAFIGVERWEEGTVTNISGGGALIELTGEISNGDYINFDTGLDDEKTQVNLTCEVVRITHEGDSKIAHTAFVGITERVRDKIIKYVFQRQLDKIRSEQKELEAARRRR